MNKRLTLFFSTSIREVVFGLEDSLVSTLGTMTGIAVGSQSTYIVILAGIVRLFAESASMAAGSYLSSKSALGVEKVLDGENHNHEDHAVEPKPVLAATVMGLFYFFGGQIPLIPYFFLPLNEAMIFSVILTGASLFMVGLFVSRFTKRNALRSGLEMITVSLLAAGLGYLVGRLLALFFGIEVDNF